MYSVFQFVVLTFEGTCFVFIYIDYTKTGTKYEKWVGYFNILYFAHFIEILCNFIGGFRGERKRRTPHPLKSGKDTFSETFLWTLSINSKIFGSLRSLISILFIKETIQRPQILQHAPLRYRIPYKACVLNCL